MSRDRPYLALIAITTLFAVSVDSYLVGVPVYALEVLHTPSWLPGALLALLTVITSTALAVGASGLGLRYIGARLPAHALDG